MQVTKNNQGRQTLIEINLSDIASAKELHQVLAEKLQFPGWYGANWDAFWDAISGLVQMPHSLHFIGLQALAQRLPNDTKLLQACLEDLSDQYPELAPSITYAES